MGLAVGLFVAQRRVRPADEDGEVAAFGPGARPDRVALPALDREIAGLEVEEQRGRGVERPEQAGLAEPGLPKMQPLMPRGSASRWSAVMIGSVIRLPDRQGAGC
jgi:hypothetical protein